MDEITDRDRGIASLFEQLVAARGDSEAQQKLLDESGLDLSDDDKLDLLEGSNDESFNWDDESQEGEDTGSTETDAGAAEETPESGSSEDEVFAKDDEYEQPDEDSGSDYSDAVQDEEPHDESLADEGEDSMIKVGARFGEHIADLSHHQ